PARIVPVRTIEVERSKEQATIFQSVVPIAVHEDIPSRSPAIVGRRPDPAGPIARPIAGPPEIAMRSRHPTAGNVEGLIAGRFNHRSVVQRGGWSSQVVDPFLLDRCPEARDPLPAVFRLRPVARHPTAVG